MDRSRGFVRRGQQKLNLPPKRRRQCVTRHERGRKVLDFYAGFCSHRATCPKADGKAITRLKLILSGNSSAENEAGRIKRLKLHQTETKALGVWFSDQRRHAP